MCFSKNISTNQEAFNTASTHTHDRYWTTHTELKFLIAVRLDDSLAADMKDYGINFAPDDQWFD